MFGFRNGKAVVPMGGVLLIAAISLGPTPAMADLGAPVCNVNGLDGTLPTWQAKVIPASETNPLWVRCICSATGVFTQGKDTEEETAKTCFPKEPYPCQVVYELDFEAPTKKDLADFASGCLYDCLGKKEAFALQGKVPQEVLLVRPEDTRICCSKTAQNFRDCEDEKNPREPQQKSNPPANPAPGNLAPGNPGPGAKNPAAKPMASPAPRR